MKARRSPTKLIPILTGTLLLLFASPAFCDNRVDIDVSDACLISPGNDSLSSRVLLKFDLPSKLSDKRIDYAEVVFNARIDTSSRFSVMFAGYPVTSDWNKASVSWSGSWTNDGGDHNDSLYEIGLIKAGGDGVVRFDITRLVTSWQQEAISNYGLIVIPLEEDRKITELIHPSGYPQEVYAKVRVYFSYTHP